MTYIERLQNNRELLIEFFNAFKDLEAKETKWDDTAYKGDARRIADAARLHLNTLRAKVEDMIAKSTKKEAANA